MLTIGLTGSLGMGKTTCKAMFAERGLATFDADAAVHALYRGRAVPLVEAAFPGTVVEGAVDRRRLADRVMGDLAAIRRLEDIVHPLVRKAETAFRARAAEEERRIVLLDIPLLLETGGESRVDLVLVVSTSPAIQRERVLSRPDMTERRFAEILARQMPDAEKRRQAHVVIDTSGDFAETQRQVDDVLSAFAGVAGGR